MFKVKRLRLNKRGTLLLCVLSLVIGLAGGYIARGSNVIFTSSDSIYNEVSEIITSTYLDTVDSELSIEERMIKGMVSGLGDPYTVYMEPSEAEQLTSSINGSFVGIGVSYAKIEKGGIIIQVFKDSPADLAGVKAGDIITHVNGTEIKSYTSDKIRETILGEPGTEVSIRVLRQGVSKDITIIRNQVESSLESEIKSDGDVLYGYVRLTTFGDNTADLLEEQLKVFKSANIEKIVIDLRGNSGGYLTAVQDMLNLFVEKDQVLFSVQYNDGDITEIRSTNREKYTFKQGIVLINGSSASSSEVMAAGLSELLDYQLIGTTTYGKGIVQGQAVLSDSSTLKYTHSKWLTPSGKCIHNEGIAPDIEVEQMLAGDVTLFNLEDTFEYDDVSEYVAVMQKILKLLNYDVDREDGYFSKKTQEQLKLFEKQYNLEVNGIFEQDDLSIMLGNLIYELTYNTEDQVLKEAVKQLNK